MKVVETVSTSDPDVFVSARPSPSKVTKSSMKATQRFQTAPELRDRALLVRVDATNSGRVYNIEGESFGLGRHPKNEVHLDDDGISRHHAKITRQDQSFWLTDLDSSNGTYLNGTRIATCELTNGDTLQLGPRVSFRFALASEHEEGALKKLYDSSVRDPMTGAYNRQYFTNRLTMEHAYVVRHKMELSLIMLDVDFFKKINDTHGHLAGDAVLRQVTSILAEQLRTEDLLARYGGEEFILLLRGIPISGARLAAERLRSAVAKAPIPHENKLIPVTISLGCTSTNCEGANSVETMIACADRRLYAAKHQGRNRVVASG